MIPSIAPSTAGAFVREVLQSVYISRAFDFLLSLPRANGRPGCLSPGFTAEVQDRRGHRNHDDCRAKNTRYHGSVVPAGVTLDCEGHPCKCRWYGKGLFSTIECERWCYLVVSDDHGPQVRRYGPFRRPCPRGERSCGVTTSVGCLVGCGAKVSTTRQRSLSHCGGGNWGCIRTRSRPSFSVVHAEP